MKPAIRASRPPFPLQEAFTVGGGQPVDNAAEESEQRDFADGDDCRQDGHDDQPRHGILNVMPDKRTEALRRNAGAGFRKRIDAAFEEAEHGEPIWRGGH
jgi:hypothetical protein